MERDTIAPRHVYTPAWTCCLQSYAQESVLPAAPLVIQAHTRALLELTLIVVFIVISTYATSQMRWLSLEKAVCLRTEFDPPDVHRHAELTLLEICQLTGNNHDKQREINFCNHNHKKHQKYRPVVATVSTGHRASPCVVLAPVELLLQPCWVQTAKSASMLHNMTRRSNAAAAI